MKKQKTVRTKLLETIKKLLESDKLWGKGFYDRIKDLDDLRLKKLLILLFNFSERRKKLGEKGDEIIIKHYEEQVKIAQKIINNQINIIRREAEKKEREKEEKEALKMLDKLNNYILIF